MGITEIDFLSIAHVKVRHIARQKMYIPKYVGDNLSETLNSSAIDCNLHENLLKTQL